jgi:hypothetical protein
VQAFVIAVSDRWLLSIEFLISRADRAAVEVGGLDIERKA